MPTQKLSKHAREVIKRQARTQEDRSGYEQLPPGQHHLRAHLRTAIPLKPRPTPPPDPFTKHKRTTDPAKLRGIGMKGHPDAIVRGIAGAGQLDLIRQHEREAIIAAGETIDITQVLEAHLNQCYLCGTKLTVNTAQQEHIIPISKGGTHTTANVSVACSRCNIRKSNRYVAFMVRTRKPIYVQR